MAMLISSKIEFFGLVFAFLSISAFFSVAAAEDTNRLFNPCGDTTVQRLDGFTFGIAFSSSGSFVFNNTGLSPCDRRLSLTSAGAKLAVFRPKVDEITILTINTSSYSPDFPAVTAGGFMVAFAGRKYAARSPAAFVGNAVHTITSFTLVLEFEKGRLQNMLWKKDGCSKCSGNSTKSPLVCLNGLGCAAKTENCKRIGSNFDCSLSIQVAFSGTDKHYNALNSWYEISKLSQYSLYSLYSDLKSSVSNQISQFF
ncbi:expp1 protein [Wolffia australiana]